MKMLIALVAVLSVSAAFASFNPADEVAKPNQVFQCSGPVSRANGLKPVGAPGVRVIEYLEKAGPMLPAFKSVFVLEVYPMNPMVPSTLYKLEYVNSPVMDIHVYAVVNDQGEKTVYTVEHNIFKGLFTVKVGQGAFKYTCSAPRY